MKLFLIKKKKQMDINRHVQGGVHVCMCVRAQSHLTLCDPHGL